MQDIEILLHFEHIDVSPPVLCLHKSEHLQQRGRVLFQKFDTETGSVL